MALAEFLAGYLRAMRRVGVEDMRALRREVSDAELASGGARTALIAGVAAFWARHGAAIDVAPGVPAARNGARPANAWHAGRELAHVRQRRKPGFAAGDWGQELAAAMTADAVALAALTITRDASGSLVVGARRRG